MPGYQVTMTVKIVDDWRTKTITETYFNLRQALTAATDWVTEPGMSYERRTARVVEVPDEEGDEIFIALMDVEVE